jgi:fatty-acyl-CoA synthase
VLETPARPRTILLIEDMPVTPVGKIYKPRLREIAAEQAARDALSAALDGAPLEVAARHEKSGLILTAKVSTAAVAAARAELGKFPLQFEVLGV